MEETREETPQDLRNLALKVAGLLEEAGQHALHDQLNPRNLAQPSTENADRGPRYKLEVDNKIMRFMSVESPTSPTSTASGPPAPPKAVLASVTGTSARSTV